MSFFNIGIGKYLAASYMSRQSSSSSLYNPYENSPRNVNYKKEWRRITRTSFWKNLPKILKASKCQMLLKNCKTGETIVIDGSKPMPDIPAEWLEDGEYGIRNNAQVK